MGFVLLPVTSFHPPTPLRLRTASRTRGKAVSWNYPAVRQISFIYYNTTTTTGYDLYILGFSIGTATAIAAPPVTAISNSASVLVASTKLYPNPVSDQANIQLDLVTPSDVKVSLSDMMGREVMTIAQGSSMSSVTQSFSLANLQKGIYTVNYFVNGAAAKSELLMVK